MGGRGGQSLLPGLGLMARSGSVLGRSGCRLNIPGLNPKSPYTLYPLNLEAINPEIHFGGLRKKGCPNPDPK